MVGYNYIGVDEEMGLSSSNIYKNNIWLYGYYHPKKNGKLIHDKCANTSLKGISLTIETYH